MSVRSRRRSRDDLKPTELAKLRKLRGGCGADRHEANTVEYGLGRKKKSVVVRPATWEGMSQAPGWVRPGWVGGWVSQLTHTAHPPAPEATATRYKRPSTPPFLPLSRHKQPLSTPPSTSIMAESTDKEEAMIIAPPPQLKSVIIRTAKWVRKSGKVFETKIKLSEKGQSPQFAFLHEGHIYHAYYRHQVDASDEEFQKTVDDIAAAAAAAAAPATEGAESKSSGGGDGSSSGMGATAGGAGASVAVQSEVVLSRVETVAKGIKLGESPYPKLYFSTPIPTFLSAADSDVMKLTAQFAAQHGDSFLDGLRRKEHDNALFSFIKPTHALFSYFESLVASYKLILNTARGSQS